MRSETDNWEGAVKRLNESTREMDGKIRVMELEFGQGPGLGGSSGKTHAS